MEAFPRTCNTHHALTALCYVLSRLVMSDSLRPYGLKPSRLLCPWGFSRQEYWSGLPCYPPGDLPNPGIKPMSPALQVDSLLSEPPGKPLSKSFYKIFHIPYPRALTRAIPQEAENQCSSSFSLHLFMTPKAAFQICGSGVQ